MRKKKKEEKCKMIIKLEMDKEMYKAMKRYEKAREENNEEEMVKQKKKWKCIINLEIMIRKQL